MNRLQQIADRPIGESERRGAFLAAASVLIVAAAILLVIPSGQREVDGPEFAAIASRETVVARPSQRTESNDAPESAARRFLSGYLRFAYGQSGAKAITSVSPSLLAKLADSRGRVPPAARNRDPRVTDLEVRNIASERAAATASIDVEGVSFTITMKLDVRDGRWLVGSVGAD